MGVYSRAECEGSFLWRAAAVLSKQDFINHLQKCLENQLITVWMALRFVEMLYYTFRVQNAWVFASFSGFCTVVRMDNNGIWICGL